MKSNQHKRWVATAIALVTGTAFAQEPPLPQPAPPVSDQQVVPAVVMPPLPALPPPIVPTPVESDIELAGHRGARLMRPIAIPANSMPVVAAPAPWPNLAMPTYGSTAPQWRWYGWGAANPAGWGKSTTPVDALMNAIPAPTPANEAPKPPVINPPTGLIGDVKSPEPSWNSPPKKVETSPPIQTEAPAPTLTPPNLDLNLNAPRPASTPASVPTSVDPWTGIGPGVKANGQRPEVVAASSWKTVRAVNK